MNSFLKALSYFLLFFFSDAAYPNSSLKVGLVLDKGGKDDKSFNASAFSGATEAKKQLGIHLKVLECQSDSAIAASLRTFAQHNYDLIIGIGFVQQSPIEEVAKEFPNLSFLLVDAPSSLPNVRSVIFNEHEGSYLVGVIAALTTKTNHIGFIGGMDIPLIRRFERGFRAGAQSVEPRIKTLTYYVGASSDAWRNPTKAKELALGQFSKGVDISFCAAGSSCAGVFDAAEESHRLAIGVDSNQNWVKPGFILTSMVKGVDLAVFQTIEQKLKGRFKPGIIHLGLKEGAISYSLDQYNRPLISAQVEKQTNAIRNLIMKGTIVVPDYYKENQRGQSK